jgi:hypothetical protein
MALLVYSDKCKWSLDIIGFIKSKPELLEIVRFHNISEQGVPSKKITKVPTLVTNQGVMHVGGDVKTWLNSMLNCDFESWDATGSLCANLDGSGGDGLFDINKYGESLQPNLTPELEERISMSVMDAYQKHRT